MSRDIVFGLGFCVGMIVMLLVEEFLSIAETFGKKRTDKE